MKNRIAIIKQQIGSESKKSVMVVLGFMSGTAIAKGMDMLTEKFPEAEPFVKYARPILLAGGGLLISSATTKEESLKYFGYGVTTAGAFDGIKLVPFVKDYLGLSGLESGMPTTYYTENNSSNLELGNFGINALPVKSFTMEDAPSFKIHLPDLEGTQNSFSGNTFGYNGDATDETDKFKGIL
jgi:hypothetical protein